MLEARPNGNVIRLPSLADLLYTSYGLAVTDKRNC